ncbi:MAG: hypothetical protein IJA06_02490, partial [Oscillospiraceae bacterium]|nr:hypothetical protein [Oscillospiraceae bacterium]
MTETQKRIEAYKKALPEIRERVIAVALLFAMSMAMMTSATFAWLTISRAPEVTAVSTTVAANGNLEIALATGDGTIAPGESKVGDSSANEKQPVTRANITWGNLVNLSDPNYGLDNLVLRPAQLNAASLLDSPLYAAEYQSDGRIDRIASSFSFTSWVPSDGVVPGYFGLSTNLGVRAISSTKVSATGVFAQIFALKDAAEAANSNAVNKYIELTQNDGYMTSLAYIMGVFMTDRLNASQGDDNLTNPTVNKEDLGNLISMYTAFIEVFEMEAQAKADLLNLQLFIKKNSGSIEDYTPYTIESLLAGTTTANSLKAQGLTLNEFTRFKADYNLIKNDLEVLKKLNESGTVKWQGTKVTTDAYSTERSLKNVINSLVNLNTCTLDGTPIQNIGASNASGYLNKSCQAVITNGVLYEFEKRTGAEMHVGEKYNNGKGLKLEATVKRGISIDGKIYAIITTSAPQPSVFSTDLSSAMDTSNVNFEGTVEAEDTYGMAIDLWVRTNAPSSYLTLEGNVLTKTETVRSMGTDAEGNPVELYTLSGQEEVEVEETDSETGEVSTKTETVFYEIDVYKIVTTDDSGEETETWYNHSNYSEVSEKYLEDADPKPKMEEVITVIGYEGENRIWGSETLNNTMSSILSTDSTTQGSGSCYVYYADTPEDQANSLNLLKAFKVAFITEDEESEAGRLLAIAEMDT